MKKAKKATLVIVSTCTNKKRGMVEDCCRLDDAIQGNCSLTAKKWFANLSKSAQSSKPAARLYKGEHWQQTLNCFESAAQQGFRTGLWVLSAGWGLISADTELAPYAATFSTGHDSVQNLPWPHACSLRDKSRAWWVEVHKRRMIRDAPLLNALPTVFGSRQKPTLLFIISKEYYPAVEPDLVELASKGHKVAIVSAGLYSDRATASPLLRDFILPLNDKFKQVDDYLNKTNTSLNARLATWIVKTYPRLLATDLPGLNKALAELGSSLPAMVRKDVVRMTDAEVLGFIDEHFQPTTSSATKLLRTLRDEYEMSCEQKRFGRLFEEYRLSDRNRGLFDG
jgi:hypothetical protein